jgi:hypothetical protein
MFSILTNSFVYFYAVRKDLTIRNLDAMLSRGVWKLSHHRIRLHIILIVSTLWLFLRVNLAFAVIEQLVFRQTFVHAGDYILGAYLLVRCCVDMYLIFDVKNWNGMAIYKV